MPRGTLDPRGASSIPAQSPLYPQQKIEWSDVDAIQIEYYTSAAAIQHLIPDDFELDDEPLIQCSAFRWGSSPFGSYNELITFVEVGWNGARYFFALELILENEAALFMGREQLGAPKIIGRINFDPPSVSSPATEYLACVERPIGRKIMDITFRPNQQLQNLGPVQIDPNRRRRIALRIIPGTQYSSTPSIREYVVIDTFCTEAEVWAGRGSIEFVSAANALTAQVPVLRYAESKLIRSACMQQAYVQKGVPLDGQNVARASR